MILDFTQDSFVSAFEFSMFLRWFGPLTGCNTRLVEPVSKGYVDEQNVAYYSSFLTSFIVKDACWVYPFLRGFKSTPGKRAWNVFDTIQQITLGFFCNYVCGWLVSD